MVVVLVTKSCLTLVTPQTVACQSPLSMGFSRQEYWIGLLCPPPGDLCDPGIEPMFSEDPAFQVDSLLLIHQGNLESSHTMDPTHVPCIVRWILNHWTTKEVPGLLTAM